MLTKSTFIIQNSKFIIAVAILVTAGIVNNYYSRPDVPLPRRSFSEFPQAFGDWIAVSDQKIDDRSIKVLQVDDYMMRFYRNSNGEFVGLYIGYFNSQREGKGIHSPRQCLPGAGWFPVQTAVHEMPGLNHNSEIIPVNKFIMGKGLDRQLYLFWYQGRGRSYASEYWNKIYLVLDGLTKRRTDGALIRLNNNADGDTKAALKIQSDFIKTIFPLLKDYIPE